tara:strand:+ start:975 stop:1490 length:516 start_codon:yes stop_codon:yes gene_type:complete
MQFKHPISKISFTKIQIIRSIVDENPHTTLQEIGNKLGITRERVRQLINMNNKYSSLFRYTSGKHGLPFIDRKNNKEHRRVSSKYLCDSCGKRSTAPVTKCNKCRVYDNREIIVCKNCNKTVEFLGETARYRRANRKTNKSGNEFCSRKCSSSYIGRHFGFGATRSWIEKT